MELNSIDDVRSNLEEIWGRQLATEFAVKVLTLALRTAVVALLPATGHPFHRFLKAI